MDSQAAAGAATMALGASQLLTPQLAAKAFGMRELDGQGVWLARLLGASNLGLGALSLQAETRSATTNLTQAVMAAEAVATVASAASGGLPKRTAVMVLGFLAALAAADLLVE